MPKNLHSCSCHPFKDWDEHDYFSKQKINIGTIVKDRCTAAVSYTHLDVYKRQALLHVFSVKNDIINAKNHFEYNTISRYYSMFHQKFTGL